jgi:hypothetical protein
VGFPDVFFRVFLHHSSSLISIISYKVKTYINMSSNIAQTHVAHCYILIYTTHLQTVDLKILPPGGCVCTLHDNLWLATPLRFSFKKKKICKFEKVTRSGIKPRNTRLSAGRLNHYTNNWSIVNSESFFFVLEQIRLQVAGNCRQMVLRLLSEAE